MRNVYCAVLLTALMPVHALADDAAAVEPATVEPPALIPGSAVYDWNGIYAGIGFGYGAFLDGMGGGGEGVFGEVIIGYDHLLDSGLLAGIAMTARFGDIKSSFSMSGVDGGWIAEYGFDIYGRLGFMMSPQTLGYVLAGYTWQRIDLGSAIAGGNWDTNGVVAGFGTETALSGNWTLKHEYRYSQYYSLYTDPAVHSFHTGLNYRFNGGPSSKSMVAPDHDWSGLKAGLAVGTGAMIHEVSESFIGTSFNGVGADGFIGDINLGYDHDLGNGYVVGAVIAANLSSIGGEIHTGFVWPPTVGTLPPTGVGLSVDTQSKYGFDAMLRVGRALDSRTLAYAIGGYTWQHFEMNTSIGVATDWDASGFTIGTGIEIAFSERMSGYSEYRYSEYQEKVWDNGAFGTNSNTPSSHTVRIGAKIKLH